MTKIDIFISHSTADKEIVKYFVDDILIGCLGFHHTQIFCTSLDGMKITSGEDWRRALKEALISSEVTFLIITPNYKSSEICLNEMGAAWIMEKHVIPIAIEPVNYKSVGALQEINHVEKMNDEKSLDKIKDSIESIFSGRKVRTRSDRWTEKKQEFLAKLEALLDDKPFAEPVTRDVMDGLIIELQKLKQINQNLSKANLRLSRTVDDLSALKDADTVRLVKKKHGLTKEKDEFISLVKRVSTALNEFHPSIITCIYNSYTGHDLRIDFQLYANRIDEAISRDYIDSEQDVLWNETAEMEEVSSSLSELENCLLSLPEITRTELEKEYNCKLKTNNLKFWETVINAKLYYE